MELSFLFFDLVIELPPSNLLMLGFLIALTIGSYRYMKKFREDRVLELGNLQTLKEIHGHESMISPVVLGIKVVVVTLLFLTATDSIRLETSHPVTETDFVFALDTSQSMLAPDYEPNRIDHSKQVLENYIREIPGESRISIVEYSGDTRVVSANRRKQQAIKDLKQVEVNLSDPGTAMAPAIVSSVRAISSSDKNRRLVLVTDGKNTAEMNISEAVTEARDKNVRIDVIAITPTERLRNLYEDIEQRVDRELDFQSTGVDVEKMQRITTLTGGEYYHVGDPNMLESAMEDIVTREERLGLNSDYIILIFISLIVITEIGIYSRYGAI